MRTVKEIAWLAGLLEGESSFQNTKGSPVIDLQMTDRDVLDRAAALLGVSVSAYVRKPKGKESYKEVWSCKAHGTRAIGWMMTLYPLMGKRRQEKIREILADWKASDRVPRAPRGERFMATCHPERVRSGRGLCHKCYMREYRKAKEAGVTMEQHFGASMFTVA